MDGLKEGLSSTQLYTLFVLREFAAGLADFNYIWVTYNCIQFEALTTILVRINTKENLI